MFADKDLTMKYKEKIVSTIFGKTTFHDFPPPNRRLDIFLKSRALNLIHEDAEHQNAFENAFNILKHEGFIAVVIVEKKHIMSCYFDGIDIFCHYAKKVADRCFVSLTEKGFKAWDEFRETGKWNSDSEKT